MEQAAAEIIRLRSDLEHADICISRFNSGAELQALMIESEQLRAALSTAREDALREAEQRCRIVAQNAEHRAAIYTSEEDKASAMQAIASAMDKREGALLCADAILALIPHTTKEEPKP